MKLVKTLKLTLLPPHPEVDYSHGDFYSTMHKSPPLKMNIDLFPCCYMCIQVHIISGICYSGTYYRFARLSFAIHIICFFCHRITGAWHPTSALYYLIFTHSNQSFISVHAS